MPERQTAGPAFCSTQEIVPVVTSRAGSSIRAEQILERERTPPRGPSFSLQSLGGSAARALQKIAPFGASEPNSATSPPTGCSGSLKGFTTLRSTGPAGAASRSANVLAGQPSGNRSGWSSGVSSHRQLRRSPACGGEQILHVDAGPVGFRSTSTGVGVADLVEPVEADIDPGAPGDRGEVQDGVGRAADRHQHAQRVLDRFLGNDLVGRDLCAGPPSAVAAQGRLGSAQPVMDGPGDRRAAREIIPSASAIEAIVLAVPMTAQVPAVVADALDLSGISSFDTSCGAVLGPEAAAIGAGAEPFAV